MRPYSRATLGGALVLMVFALAVTAPFWMPAGRLLDAIAYWLFAAAVAIVLLLVTIVPISWYVERQVEEYDSREADAR